jgi:hypothetical protein
MLSRSARAPPLLSSSSSGKNKKGKLGDRKDANNNAANKLSQKMFAENPLEFLSKQSMEIKQVCDARTPPRAHRTTDSDARLSHRPSGTRYI